VASLSRVWQVVIVLLVAVVVTLAALLILYSVPLKEVRQSQANRFDFTMTQSGNWYFAPWGYPCPNNESSCTVPNFFGPPSDAIGSYLVAFSWYSDRNTTVQFLFWNPDCQIGVLPHTAPLILYSANSTHGGFAIESTVSIQCIENTEVGGPNFTVPWWDDGATTFEYGGQGPVTVVGAVSYTAQVSVPIL
jgi:hypothetical protein